MAKGKSRSGRWAAALSQMREGLEELKMLQEEYADWQSNLPEGLDSGATAEKLEAVAELDFDSLETDIDEWESVELPRGFGRD